VLSEGKHEEALAMKDGIGLAEKMLGLPASVVLEAQVKEAFRNATLLSPNWQTVSAQPPRAIRLRRVAVDVRGPLQFPASNPRGIKGEVEDSDARVVEVSTSCPSARLDRVAASVRP
jgi:hypothetical protein